MGFFVCGRLGRFGRYLCMFDYIKREFSLKATHRRTKDEVQQINLEKKNAFFKFMRVVCIVGIIFIILNMIFDVQF